MPIDYRKYPTDWKTVIRPRIMARAKNRCEMCRIPHYSVGWWQDGAWRRTGGNQHHDDAGAGHLSYKEARETATWLNEEVEEVGPEVEGIGKAIVIVLTIAHLDHDLSHNEDSNLKALCQRCHLTYDAKHHAKSARTTRELKSGQLSLL